MQFESTAVAAVAVTGTVVVATPSSFRSMVAYACIKYNHNRIEMNPMPQLMHTLLLHSPITHLQPYKPLKY